MKRAERPAARRVAWGAIVALTVAWAGPPATAAETSSMTGRLQELQRALEVSKQRESRLAKDARTLEVELEKLRRAAMISAQKKQSHEAELSRLEAEVTTLAAERRVTQAALADRHAHLSTTLMAMQRLARHPPEALIAMPNPPQDNLRAGLLMRTAISEVEAEAVRLRGELERLASLRAQLDRRQIALAAAATDLVDESRRLEVLQSEQRALLRQTDRQRAAAKRRSRALAGEVRDIRTLLERLTAEREQAEAAARERAAEAAERARSDEPPPAEEATQLAAAPAVTARPDNLRSFSGERGTLIMPARGRLARRYGQADRFGVASKGLLIETRQGAQIVAPFDGRVVFSGPFRGYGLILIIEHGGGYHTLLAGLGRIDVVDGQWLLAGEPVAVMQQEESDVPSLYVEWRRDGEPVNPLPWIADSNSKVSG